MLENLHVKNLALIKESEVTFEEGINILSGETGAGKSIILGSIRMALGAKADKDFIRHGEDYALIELVFRNRKAAVRERLEALDLPVEEDGTIIITRKIMEGRSVAKINGETVTSKGLKQVASMLINIHGQNDTAELLDTKNYLDILDDYAGAEVEALKEEVSELYKYYQELKQELDNSNSLDKNREKELSLAQFEVNEIENAKLIVGEDEVLEARFRKMNNAKRIVEALSKAYGALDDAQGASSLTDMALREVRYAMGFDEELESVEESLATAGDILGDVKRTLSDYIADMEFSEADYNETQTRLDVITHLMNKYGDTIEKVLAYADERNEYINKLADFATYLAELEKKVKQAKQAYLNKSRVLSDIRNKKAEVLSNELVRNLKELNLNDARCEIRVDSSEENMTSEGIDSVNFLVSFNIGEPLKSLSTVASGGELSRFMLALKTITADKESIDTLIFDEIDAGISGKTAWNVAEKMNSIGLTHQVIAITHLPQIAAMANTHFLIEKESDNTSTVTDIVKLNETDSVREVARLMATDTITEAVLASAMELKAQANQVKKQA